MKIIQMIRMKQMFIVWTKTDPTELKNKIRKALKEAFYDVTINDLFETDTKVYHIAFRCYFYEKEE